MRNFLQNLKSWVVNGLKAGQQPTNNQGISNLSLTVGTMRVGQNSCPILSRFCLASLILMTMGVGEMWADASGVAIKQVTLGGASKYVVMAYEGDAKGTYYRAAEVQSRSDAVSRNNDAPAYQLYIEMKRASGTVWVDQKVKIQYSSNNSSWSETSEVTVNNTSYQMYGPYSVNADTKYVRLKSTNGTKDKYLQKVYLTMAQYVNNPSVSSLSWNAADINSTATSKNVTVAWCNVPAMTYEITGTDKDLFELSVANNSEAGKYNTATFTVTYKRTTAGSHSAKLKITDSYNSYSKEITLSGTTNKLQPTVTWSSNDDIFNVDDELSATNSNGLTVTLSSAGNESYVNCSGNTATMLAATSGKITVTAHVTGNEIYADKDFTKEITITNLEKQHITWTQDLSRLKTSDGTKSVVLNATASSGLPVTYELQGDKTGLTLTHSGSTWTLTYSASECKNTTIVAKQAGDATYAAASNVSMPVKVVDPTKVCDVNEVLVNSSTTLKSSSVTYNIDIPASMTISLSRVKTGLLDIYLFGVDVEFYSGRNGTGTKLYTKSYSTSDINNSLSNDNINLSSYINAKSVKVTTNATNGYYLTSLTYTKRKYCTLSTGSLSFETFPNTTTSAKTFKVNYANYPITLECSNNKFSFTPLEFGDCSEYGSQQISVTYSAGADEGDDIGYIYVKDNTGTTLQTCTLTVSISKVDQSITTHNIQTAYKTTDKVALTAETNSGEADFTYSAAPAGIASFAGNVMTFSQSGTIAITVSEDGSNIYKPCSETVNNVVVSKVTPDIVSNPSGTVIKYLQTLSSSILTGGDADVTLRGVANTPVDGSFAWKTPTYQVTDNAGNHSYTVVFTPTNGGMYATKEFDLPITIMRADAFISMNNGTVRVAVDGIDAGKADSKIDLDNLIYSQTTDAVAANRAGVVTYEVISANKANATIGEGNIFSATAIGEYTIRATKAETEYYNQVTADFTVTVSKRANTLVVVGAQTKFVDDEIANVATVVNSDGEIHTTSTDATIAYYDVAQNKIVIPNSSAKSFDQTTVTITISQDATARFEASEEKSITVTVKKYDNVLSYEWNNLARNNWNTVEFLNFNQGAYVSFSSQNTEAVNAPIVITQKSGNKIATYYAEQDAIYASYNIGHATWDVSQVENYKYKAASTKTLTVEVDVIDETCYVLNEEGPYELHTIQTGSPFALTAPGSQLYFEGKRTLTSLNQFFIQYSTNGEQYEDLQEVNLSQIDWESYGPYDLPEGTTHIRFVTKTGASYVKYYREIHVTRKQNLKLVDKKDAEITTLEMPMNVVSSDPSKPNSSSAKFYIDYNVCADEIRVVSNHSHFTVSEDVIEIESGISGVKEITVTYSWPTFEEATGTITVYTPNDHKTLTVSGRTDKQTQELTWGSVYQSEPVTLPVEFSSIGKAVVEATSKMPVKYSIEEGEDSVILIADDAYSFVVVGTGTAHLTATQEGNALWYPVEETKVINATDKKIQVIKWSQDLANTLIFDAHEPLLAEVHIQNMQTGVSAKNDARTALIQYSCPENNGVIEILEGNILHVLNYGETTITAFVAGDEYFQEAAPVTLPVKVHEPSAGCADPLLVNHNEAIQLFFFGIDWGFSDGVTPAIIADTLPIDLSAGTPDKLSFQHEGEPYVVPIFKTEYLSGNIKVQEHVGEDWNDIEGSLVSPAKNAWNEISGLQLDSRADAIRFVREAGATGYHYVNNVKVTLLPYLRTDNPVVNLGNVQMGAVLDTTINIEYANVKGTLMAAIEREENEIFSLRAGAIYPVCGSVGDYDWPIRFTPNTLGEWQNVVTITDDITGREVVITVKANVTPGSMFIFEREGEWGVETSWNKTQLPTENDHVIIAKDVVIPQDADVRVKTLAINEGVTVRVNGKLTVMESTPAYEHYGNIHVNEKGTVDLRNITVGGLKVQDFILDASIGNVTHSSASGQVHGDGKLDIRGDAYFQISFDPRGKIDYGWYDFTVPFEVDAKADVFDKNGNKLTYNVDYAVMDFSEEKRAANAKYWNWFSGTLQPNRLYSITFDDEKNWNTFLFKKKSSTASFGTSTYSASYTNTGETNDRGWNGMGNGTLRHCQLNNLPAQTKILAYDHENDRYIGRDADQYTYAVGTTFFVQVDEEKDVDLTSVSAPRGFLAPARNDGRSTDEFRLVLTSEDGTSMADQLWFSASEEATEVYVIGRDLLKMGTPTNAKVAQMWATKGGKSLCDVEVTLVNDEAITPLAFFAPQAGEYTIAIEQAPDDADLYLTYNGEIIWDLTASPYMFELSKGTTNAYGLKMMTRAPKVATGVDNADAENIAMRKVIINDKVYVITPEGKMYDVIGKCVKY